MKSCIALISACLVLITACSSANWYQSGKSSGEIECRKQPAGRYEECMREYDKTYQQYKQQREDAIRQ